MVVVAKPSATFPAFRRRSHSLFCICYSIETTVYCTKNSDHCIYTFMYYCQVHCFKKSIHTLENVPYLFRCACFTLKFRLCKTKSTYRSRAISGRDSYCFKGGFWLFFPLKNKIKAHPSYENKQEARSITECPEMALVWYINSYSPVLIVIPTHIVTRCFNFST